MLRPRRRHIYAGSEADMEMEMDMDVPAGGSQVAPEASDLLFEAEDVAELVAEITGQAVEVTADEDVVTFAVGDEEYTVEADGDEEILEASRRAFRRKRTISASTNRRPVRGNSRVVKNVPYRRK